VTWEIKGSSSSRRREEEGTAREEQRQVSTRRTGQGGLLKRRSIDNAKTRTRAAIAALEEESALVQADQAIIVLAAVRGGVGLGLPVVDAEVHERA